MRRIAAVAVAALSAIALAVPGIVSANSAAGITYNSNAPFKVTSTNVQGTAHVFGTPTVTGYQAQVRILKDGSQVGSIVTYGSMSAGTYYDYNPSATYPCQGIGVYHTFVTQSRLVRSTPSGPIVQPWDSGPGKNLLCS